MSKLIIANWKCNPTDLDKAKHLFGVVQRGVSKVKDIEIVICPPFVYLSPLMALAQDKMVFGAQDCFWEQKGAFTGEISPLELKNLGCHYVIVGHSERRRYLNETDEMVNQKVKAVLQNGLVPIICVGETLEERQSSNKDFIIMNQVNKAIEGVDLSGNKSIIIAYEPVWGIGSGQTVEPQEAEHTNQVIRQILIDKYPLETINEKIYILYGGSVNPTNIREFLSQATIDGALVGGASLDADTFWQIINAVE